MDAKKAGPDTSGRLKEILDIIRKYNYDDGFTPEIVVGIIQDLGPTFVKIGQIASQQSEFIPPEYCDALSKLRSRVAPMDAETVHAQIEKHLGKPTEELFASFDDTPLGSASIGQVHKAVLFDGTTVAVKVRRPGVVDTVARDFALIEKVLDSFVKDDEGGFDIKGFIAELEKTSKTELDFTNEAANLERFWDNNSGRDYVESPKCYREYTNEAILTEDFVTGHEVGDTEYVSTLDADERERIAALVADNYASQVLVDGFYHADPHSGNVLIKELAPAGPKHASEASAEAPADGQQLLAHSIEWIDFGMMGLLNAQQRQILVDLVSSVVMQDSYSLKRAVLKAAHPKGEIDHGAMLEMCENMCGLYTGADLGDFDLGDLLGSIVGGLQEESYEIEPFLTNLARGIVAMEGTIKALSPNINILNYFIDKVDVGGGIDFDFSSLDSDDLAQLNGPIAMELLKFFDSVSRSTEKTAETLDMLEKSQITVHTDLGLEHRTLKSITQLLEYAIRAVLIAAIIVGSCLLCTVPLDAAGTTPFLIAFPILGSIGFIVGVFFAYRLRGDMNKK